MKLRTKSQPRYRKDRFWGRLAKKIKASFPKKDRVPAGQAAEPSSLAKAREAAKSKPKPQSKTRLAIMAAIGAALAILLWQALPLLLAPLPVAPLSVSLPLIHTLPPLAPLSPGPFGSEAAVRSGVTLSQTIIKSGDTLSQALEYLGLERRQSQILLNLLERDKVIPVLMPGAVLKAYWASSERSESDLERLEYYSAEGVRPIIFLPGGPDGFVRFSTAGRPVIIHEAAQGVVEDSFWGAGEKAGLSPKLILGLADLMASQIDFVSDIRTGDNFQLLFRASYLDGRLDGTPEMEMIRMTNRDEKYEFYRYEGSGGLSGYYDANGHSIKKAFFKSPLQFTRISSGYTMRRMHPIHKVIRPHQGVDYAAPAGTPVSSVAAGTVAFVGRRGGYGNLVVIKHHSNYETMYAHLSRFAKGLKIGLAVNQGQEIGYVGSTGTATGPHLDFRLKLKGAFIDPVSELAKAQGELLPQDERFAFSQQVTRLQALMKELIAFNGNS
jgi:murein DD-endopeptidase MepM/ murein hydrolase activator NlpD